MEKLQPLITHRFWVLNGLVVILALLGWYLGTNALVAETKDKTAKIESADANVPKGDMHPNKIWKLHLQEINGKRKTESNLSAADLHRKQIILMTWPASIAANFDGVGYRDPIKSTSTQPSDDARKHYPTIFQTEVVDPLVQIVTPFNSNTGEGLVIFEVGQMAYFPNYGTYTPTSKEMWDAQEDSWLTRSLLTAIANVNKQEKSTSHEDAAIQQIHRFELHAGSKPNLVEFSGGTPKGMQANKPGGPNSRKGPSTKDSRGGGSTGGTGQTAAGQKNADTAEVTLETKIDQVKVFGEPKLGEDQLENQTQGDLLEDPRDLTEKSASSGPKPRYVEKGSDLPFRTRGFILKLNMKSEALPLLLKELNQLEWPVEIRRVHTKLEEPDLEGENKENLEFNTETEQGKKTTTRTKNGRGSSDQGISATVGTPKKQTKGNSRRSKAGTSSKENNDIIVVRQIIDRRSDIEVEIAGVLTIYKSPDKDSGIAIPTLHTRGNSTPKTSSKSTTKTDKSDTSKIKKNSNK